MKNWALLDENAVLVGYEPGESGPALGTRPSGVEIANAIEVPMNCDLRLGHYAWVKESQSFVPIPPLEGTSDAPADPNATKAIVAGFRAIQTSGIGLPAETVAWLDWYDRTIEGSMK